MLSDKMIFRLYTLNRRWFNTTLLRRRGFDGHVVSMQQSGTHWLKNMLAQVFVRLYDLPPLAHIQDDSIIGHPRSLPKYKHIPQIVHSHSYPHGLTLVLPFLYYPKYLVLVRDLKTSLISHYERFKPDYPGVSWDEYLRGDVRQKKFHSDIYSRIRFMNEWGNLAARYPDRVRAIRYEGMKVAPDSVLGDVCTFFGCGVIPEAILADAVAASTPEKMAQKPNPDITTTVVRTGERKPVEAYFGPENQMFFEETCRAYLKHDFGYGGGA